MTASLDQRLRVMPAKNPFLFSLILSGPKTKTVPVSVFAFFVRKSIVQGLTMGALMD
jgi:hypothetical protein